MKFLRITLSYVFVAGLLLTCRHKEVEPDPLSDGTPRLKSISFSAIPQENISIDQKNKVITVKMPAVLLDRIGVIVEPTDNAEWDNKQDYLSAALFGCLPCYQVILKDKKDINSSLDRGVYTLQTIPSDPTIKVALLSAPFTYAIRADKDAINPYGIDIPMVNLYGNRLPKEARLTHDATGETLTIKRDSSGSYFYGVHYSSLSNRLGINLWDEKLLVGSYHIDLVLDDGALIKVSQPLLVSKGKPSLNYEAQTYFGYRVSVGKTLAMSGYNLFEGDISFDLVNQQGKITPLSGLVFDRYGRQLQVSIPTSLSPGQYVLEVYVKGVKQLDCLRLNILKDDKDHPILGTLVTKDPSEASPCSLIDPVTVQRGVALFFTSNQEKAALDKLGQHLMLKLTSLAQGVTYYGSIVAYDYANADFPGSFTVPATVSPGLYTAVLQVLDIRNNVVDESAPYGRILSVQ
ncbi:hypothetical protein [Spirosoma linguale]|uniref:Uncharacterized protein n=1 Tax=Spirosoma linguale (strain ATCC 33905 / DSM 74 / LMG 10896 / Claus 1) TaxID=504472 RepID=D2QJ88_SPILD|nr:hypothetical protein Slin_2786 [Spirosoma linguale DSM 74]